MIRQGQANPPGAKIYAQDAHAPKPNIGHNQVMTRQTRWFVYLVSTPLVALVTVGGLIGAPQGGRTGCFKHLGVFQDVLRLVLGAYVEDVNVDKVMDGAMRGLTDGLDTSSAFLQPDEVKALESKAALPAGDTGLVVTRQFYLRVLGVRDGSPAARAGLQSGDFIRMIDDKPTRDMSGVTGTRLLRGAPGSKVSVTVIRGNAADPHTFDLVREVPKGEIVRTTTVDGIARVRVASFTSGTAEALRDGVRRAGDRQPPARSSTCAASPTARLTTASRPRGCS